MSAGLLPWQRSQLNDFSKAVADADTVFVNQGVPSKNLNSAVFFFTPAAFCLAISSRSTPSSEKIALSTSVSVSHEVVCYHLIALKDSKKKHGWLFNLFRPPLNEENLKFSSYCR